MEGKSFHYENLSTIKVIGHGKTILGMCKCILLTLSMLITDVKKPIISLWERQLCINRFAALWVRRAKREKCRWKKRGENKEKWEKFWGHC
jgi:hypothetical protein